MTRNQAFFRQVMGQFATGVTVVTTATSEGLSGLTVNSFTSVSLNPPLILICVSLDSRTLTSLRAHGSFVVNVLSSEQEQIARVFATPSRERAESFYQIRCHVAVTGSPILDDILAFVDACIVAEYPGGDHTIILGQVQAIGSGGKVQHFNTDGTVHGALAECKQEGPDNAHESGQLTRTPLIYYRGQYQHLARDDEVDRLRC